MNAENDPQDLSPDVGTTPERPCQIATARSICDDYLDQLADLEAIDRDIRHHQVVGDKAVMSRLAVLEHQIKENLARVSARAIAELCFMCRSAIRMKDTSLRDVLLEVLLEPLREQFATRETIEDMQQALRVVAGRGRQ